MDRRAVEDISNFIFLSDEAEKCDLILIPGTSKSAITEKAARLYREGDAPYILPSGLYSSSLGRFASEKIDDPRYAGEYASDFEYCKHILMENGVPEWAILCENRATNSLENAMYSAEVVQNIGLRVEKAIVCCQAFHARRAFLSYSCFFPQTRLLMVPEDTQGITKENWYKTEAGWRKVMGEVAKCGKYFGSDGARRRLAGEMEE